jgi:hypothetical protein
MLGEVLKNTAAQCIFDVGLTLSHGFGHQQAGKPEGRARNDLAGVAMCSAASASPCRCSATRSSASVRTTWLCHEAMISSNTLS